MTKEALCCRSYLICYTDVLDDTQWTSQSWSISLSWLLNRLQLR